jgi:transcriptional regulator with XRE-family HTH domain
LTELARRTGIPESRIRLFLNGDIDDVDLKQHEVTMFAEVVGLGHEPDHLRHAGYTLGDCNILVENLRYLLNSLGRGRKKVLAGELGVDPTTLSRWLNGSFVPQASTLRQLVFRFGLPPATDLQEEPVFLSAQPISETERRSWLHRRIDDLRPDELGVLYPALRRLLEDR